MKENNDISDIRNKLNNYVNELIVSYSNMLNEKTEISSTNNKDILFLNNQNKLQHNEIKELNKKCYDYENIINKLQKDIIKLEEEKKCEDNVSIVISQGNELHKKDQYIEQLQKKVSFLQKEKKNITFKVEDENKINDISGGWSPTSNDLPDENLNNEEKNIEPVENNEEINMNIESDEPDEYKRIKYKGERYYIKVNEDPQYVYLILDNDDIGDKVGIRKPKKKGNGYIVEFDNK